MPPPYPTPGRTNRGIARGSDVVRFWAEEGDHPFRPRTRGPTVARAIRAQLGIRLAYRSHCVM